MRKNGTAYISLEMLFFIRFKELCGWFGFGVGPLVGLDPCWVSSSTLSPHQKLFSEDTG
jgi:hypothetical protein